MSQDLSKFTPELWSARTQNLLKNSLVGGAIANTEERATLTFGSRVHRPYHSEVYAQDYVKGTGATILDVSTTDEYLDVTTAKIIPLYVDDIDDIQNKYRTMDLLSERAAYQLRDTIDRKILAEVSNAALTNSTNWSFATGNIVQAFSEAKAALTNNGVEDTKEWFAVLDPDTISIIEQYFAANGFKVQDDTLENGYGLAAYLGDWLGLKCFKSQNVPSQVTLTLATNPTASDTLTINGNVITFVSSIGSTPGNVLIGVNAAATQTNLIGLITNPTTTNTTQVGYANSNAAKWIRRGVALGAFASNAATLSAAGKMILANSLTATTDGFGTQTLALMVGQMGAVDLVIQEDVKAEFARTTNDSTSPKLGTNILTWSLYGTKTFNEGAQRMFKLVKNA